ncbi:YfiR family protein [Neptunomonas sp.]|uniref:YfiR family protein n=1 Tax=Neptunomonas sp. TaxID=1971898 RepID=UPI0025D3360C|nr:YfiR family protein [Neptunomonas sp.]
MFIKNRFSCIGFVPKESCRKILLLLALGMYSIPAYCSEFDREITLKTGFIFNFSRFGQWESNFSDKANFTLCSPDRIFVEVARKNLAKKRVGKLPIKVIETSVNDDYEACDVIFITKQFYLNWKDNFSHPVSKGVMLIGESKGFIQAGGHINFFLLGGKIRFEVSIKNLKNSGLQLSSKVLRLGKIHER